MMITPEKRERIIKIHEEQLNGLETLRQKMKQKPFKEVKQMFANHGLMIVKGKGIFQV